MEWIKNYQRTLLAGDLTAGVIVAIMLVPQSMAYALLAGLPPQAGLYASILPLLVYGLLGTSRYLAVGPVAIVSLMVAGTVGKYAEPGSIEYQTLAIDLAWLSGFVLVIFGLLRFGRLTHFMSQTVVNGFINAAVIIISLSQVQHLVGISLPRTHSVFETTRNIWLALPDTNMTTSTIGLLSLLLLVLMRQPLAAWLAARKIRPGLVAVVTKTGAFVVVFLGAFAVWSFDLAQTHDVQIVGEIPKGLPPITLELGTSIPFPDLLAAAALIAFVSYLESISIARSLASKRRQKVGPNRELVALGFANFAAAISSAFPVAGGVSRSGVNFSAGAETQLSSLITAVLIAFSILVLSPLFYFIPKAVLAAIVVIAVLRLVDIQPVVQAWSYNKPDAITILITFVAVLVLGVELGILCGLFSSIALYLWRTFRPHIAVVGRVGESEHFRNVQYHDVKTCPHVIAVRIDESLYFANVHALEERLLELATQPDVKHIVLVCSAINFIDTSALETLELTMERLRDAGVTLHLAELKEPVMARLERSNLLRKLGGSRIFLSTHEAMRELQCV